jgi:transposase
VELLGRYSNHAYQGERIGHLLNMVPKDHLEPKTRTIKQVHRRLRPAEIDELVAAYQAGATLRQLSEQFQVHRASISIILERQNVPRRYRMVERERLQRAIRDYQDGKSIISIATELGVSGDTVRKALGRAGVKLRPRPGWRY